MQQLQQRGAHQDYLRCWHTIRYTDVLAYQYSSGASLSAPASRSRRARLELSLALLLRQAMTYADVC